ncbi:hypothetical protein NDU88_009052 [Pleurodeles waltl]|uniref:Uncharacterized protein n=1 Tax=Pleurodeles waltl TaxID=8319 RepID=A0AAV7RZD0_PLEWA|nr:hypothetical protein NDU88_009052 [Pleurodeles waltl]
MSCCTAGVKCRCCFLRGRVAFKKAVPHRPGKAGAATHVWGPAEGGCRYVADKAPGQSPKGEQPARCRRCYLLVSAAVLPGVQRCLSARSAWARPRLPCRQMRPALPVAS